MPDKSTLNFIASKSVSDLSQVRIVGAAKPFEQMTISELTQLRPGSASADSYNITAVSSDITVSTSSILADLADKAAIQAVHTQQAAHTQLQNVAAINTKITR